jgi:hypothetical protein
VSSPDWRTEAGSCPRRAEFTFPAAGAPDEGAFEAGCAAGWEDELHAATMTAQVTSPAVAPIDRRGRRTE